MKQIIYNAQTKEVTEIEVTDEEMPTIEPIVDEQAELDKAIQSATTLEELKSALLGKNKPAKVKAEKK